MKTGFLLFFLMGERLSEAYLEGMKTSVLKVSKLVTA